VVIADDKDGEGGLSNGYVSARKRQRRLRSGGYGEGEVDEAAGVARTKECHAVDQGAIEGDAVVDVLVGVLEEAASDRAAGPSVGGVFEGAFVIEAESVRKDMRAEDGAEAAAAVGVVPDNESVSDAGVKEGARSNTIASEESETVATTTVDDLYYGRVREPQAEKGLTTAK